MTNVWQNLWVNCYVHSILGRQKNLPDIDAMGLHIILFLLFESTIFPTQFHKKRSTYLTFGGQTIVYHNIYRWIILHVIYVLCKHTYTYVIYHNTTIVTIVCYIMYYIYCMWINHHQIFNIEPKYCLKSDISSTLVLDPVLAESMAFVRSIHSSSILITCCRLNACAGVKKNLRKFEISSSAVQRPAAKAIGVIWVQWHIQTPFDCI